jgi:hypothetical protein
MWSLKTSLSLFFLNLKKNYECGEFWDGKTHFSIEIGNIKNLNFSPKI